MKLNKCSQCNETGTELYTHKLMLPTSGAYILIVLCRNCYKEATK
jgi:hypothetical protein